MIEDCYEVGGARSNERTVIANLNREDFIGARRKYRWVTPRHENPV